MYGVGYGFSGPKGRSPPQPGIPLLGGGRRQHLLERTDDAIADSEAAVSRRRIISPVLSASPGDMPAHDACPNPYDVAEESHMATQENTEVESNESEGSALRRQLEAALTEVKTLKTEKRERAFKDAGLDPERGIGKAVAKLYEGDIDAGAIQNFAKEEFDWEPPGEGESQESGEPDQSVWTPERQQTLDDGESRRSALASGTLPSRDPSTTDRLKAAEAKAKETGDWSDWDRLAVLANKAS